MHMAQSLAPAPEYQKLLGLNSPLHAELLDKRDAAHKIRKQYEDQWQVNLEFLAGNHYVGIKSGKLLREPVPEERGRRKPRPVYPYSRTELETLAAYFLRNMPTWSATATRGDAKSQSAALLSKHLARYYFQLLDGDELLEEAVMWAMVTGLGIWEIGWDPNAGPEFPVQQMPEVSPLQKVGMAMGMLPPPQPITVMQRAGDPYIRLRSAFETFPDPGAQRPKDLQWVITATMRPTDDLQSEFPNFAEEIKPENPTENHVARRVLSDWGGAGASVSPEQMQRTMVLELWAKPTRRFPQGLRAVATEKVLLDAGPTPEGYDHIPFAFLRDRIVPGKFWPDATMKDLVPLNKLMNRSVAQVVDFGNKHKAKWLAVKDALDEGAINDEDGEVVAYSPGGPKPERINPPDVPDAPLKTFELARTGMEDSSGASSALQGKVVGEVRSGRQTAYNQGAAENRLALPAKHLARFLSKSGSLMLRQVATNVSEPRIARIQGGNRVQQIRMFKGADIAGATDVTVEPGSLLGFSRQERFDKVVQLGTSVPPILAPEQVLEALELEDFYNLTDEIATDRNNAYAEEEQWRQGDFAFQQEPGTVAGTWYFENHKIHVNTHNQFRKSPDYRLLPPEFRAQVDVHCKAHEAYLNAILMGAQPGAPQSPGGEPSAAPGGAADVAAQSPADEKVFPGEPPGPAEVQQSIAQSGQEIAEGLPPVKPVPKMGPGPV